MKFLILGDPHFKKNNLHIYSDITNEILNIIDRTSPDICICLGDILDTFDKIDLRTLNVASNFFIDISKKCKLIILIGNHDRENNSDYMSNIHPFIGLENYDNIDVIFKIKIFKYDKIKIICVPYVPVGKFNEALTSINYDPGDKSNSSDIIFCHQEFKGWSKPGHTSEHGDSWNVNYPYIISGHIHSKQTLNNIIYVGSILSSDYGDLGDKRIHLLDYTDSLNFKGIKLRSAPERLVLTKYFDDLSNIDNFLPKNVDNVLICINLHLTQDEVKTIKYNENYKKLIKMVDKINFIVKKIANDIVSNVTNMIKHNNKEITLDEIVNELLKDDIYTLKIFKSLKIEI